MTTIKNALLITITKVARPIESEQQTVSESRSDRAEARSARHEFWEPLLSTLQDWQRKQWPIEVWEEKITREFGYVLMSEVREYVNHDLTQVFAFKANILSYSSIVVGLDIAGVQGLVKAFNADFETFRILLEGFIYPAFSKVVGPSFADFADQMRYQISPDPQLLAQFQGGVSAQQSDDSIGTKKTTPRQIYRAKQRREPGLHGCLLIPR